MKAEVWIRLAPFFHWLYRSALYKENQNEEHPECIKGKDELLQCFLTPNPSVTCCDKALELRPNHPVMTAYKAKWMKHLIYHETTPDFEAALILLNESIEADSSIRNYVAFARRGEVYFDMYRRDRLLKRVSVDYKLDLLIKAKADYEMKIKIHASPEEYRQLGEIWRFLATMSSINHRTATLVERAVGKNRLECLEKALEEYTLAISVEGGSVNPKSQWKRGECLLDLGNFQEAAECYKMAIKYNNHDDLKMIAHSKLLYTQLKMLRLDDKHSNDALFDETTKWLKDAAHNFGDQGVAEKCFHFISSRYGREGIMRNFQCFMNMCREKGDADLASLVEKHTVLRKGDTTARADRGTKPRSDAANEPREYRKNNVIIHNLPEKGQNEEEIEQNDTRTIQTLFDDGLHAGSKRNN